MENLDIYILTSIVATLFAVFLFVLAAKLFEDEKVPKRDKEIIYKAVNRTIADMESDGIYFSEDAKEELRKQRDELHCEYSGLPSPKAYEVNQIIKSK